MSEQASSEPANSVRALPPRIQWRIVGAAFALLVVSVIVLWWSGRAQSSLPAATTNASGFRPTKEQWAQLKIATVENKTFRNEVVADGAIAYNDDTTTPVYSPYSGRVTRLIAKPGDVVKQGASLATVEASEFAQGQIDIASARAQLGVAQATEARQHALYLAKAGALKDWLQAQADLRSAQATFDGARNRLRILGKSDAEIDALTSKSVRAGTNAQASIVAPIAGSVTQRQVGLGQYITAGNSTPIFSIGNLATVWLIANVREADAAQVQVGNAVEVRVLAFPERRFAAKIAWVAPAVDTTTHRLPVRAQIDNPDGLLKPAMFANFRIESGGEAQAPAVPKSAIVYEGDEARVYVARDDGNIDLRKIRVGRTNVDLVEVVEGLSSGEKIVTAGTLFIDRAVDTGT